MPLFGLGKTPPPLDFQNIENHDDSGRVSLENGTLVVKSGFLSHLGYKLWAKYDPLAHQKHEKSVQEAVKETIVKTFNLDTSATESLKNLNLLNVKELKVTVAKFCDPLGLKAVLASASEKISMRKKTSVISEFQKTLRTTGDEKATYQFLLVASDFLKDCQPLQSENKVLATLTQEIRNTLAVLNNKIDATAVLVLQNKLKEELKTYFPNGTDKLKSFQTDRSEF